MPTAKQSTSQKETEHICSILGIKESIQKGLQTPVEECDTEVLWELPKSNIGKWISFKN